MSTLPRLLRFNLVGVLGAVVQLATLALLDHLVPRHYLLTSAAALEVTLLHNVTWHIHYTWPDRTHTLSTVQQVTRFHFANGVTSLASNLALVRLLVHTAHVPVVAANGIAILACSLLNYTLANAWIFQPRPSTTLRR